MLPLRAERANVSGTVMHQPMPNHLILALEALAAFGAWAVGHGAVVRADGAVDVSVRAGSVLAMTASWLRLLGLSAHTSESIA